MNQEKNKQKIKLVTRTAIGIALVVAAQFIGKLIPSIAAIFGPFSVSQLITGTLVNCILIVFTLQCGVWSGIIIGILSSILATIIGVGPIFPILTPIIALGNGMLVAVFWLLSKKANCTLWLSAIVGSAAKCAFLWLLVPYVLGFVPDANAKQIAMLTIMFSWPQGITALCGSFLGLLIHKKIQKAI